MVKVDTLRSYCFGKLLHLLILVDDEDDSEEEEGESGSLSIICDGFWWK
jgi:hypothetical protein